MRALVAVVALSVWACACNGVETRRIELRRVAPGVDPACGAPADARQVIVTALGDFPVAPATAESFPTGDTRVDIDKFPETTRVLSVQVLGLGGEERVIGRSAALDFDALDDGDAVAVFTAPRRGFCPVSPMSVPRIAPLVARAGAGVLVAGGFDGAGVAVTSVERYDPERGQFDLVPGAFFGDEQLGLRGASMTALADGRVVVVGGARDAYQVYDVASDALGNALFLERARAYHAAVALPDGRVLLAGGCSALASDGTCVPGSELADTSILDVDDGDMSDGPSLAGPRVGGSAVLEPDGRVLLSGGVGADGIPVTRAERIDPLGGPNESINLVAGPPALLASGAALAGFASGDDDGDVWVVPPGGQIAARVDTVAPRTGATLTALDDSAVLIVGGAGVGEPEALVYAPATETLVPLASAPQASRRDHGAVLLGDGTVLVLGGSDVSGDALADAWIYRHDLTNAFTSELAIDVGDSAQTRLLTPTDPATAGLNGDGYSLTAPGALVVAAGPTFLEPAVTLRAAADDGLSILVGFVSVSEFTAIRLVPGEPAALQRVRNGAADTLCTGGQVPQLAEQTRIGVVVSDGRVRATVADDEVLSCELAAPIPRGHVGVGSHESPLSLTVLDAVRQ